MKINNIKARLFEYFCLILATIVVFAPIIFFEIHYAGTRSDYGSHITWAQDILENIQNVPASIIAHASWQWITILVHVIVKHSWKTAAFVVTFGSVLLTNGILFWLLKKKLNALLAGSLSIGLLLVAPLFIIDPYNNLWYMVNGYIGPNVYHNPTILLLKTLAILQTVYSIIALNGQESNWKGYIIPAICSAIAVYTKPNYAICLLPVLCILALIRILKKQPVDWKRLLFGIILPSVAILIWQYLITFGPKSDSSIFLLPFAVMQNYSSDLLPKLLLSIVFPLVVTGVYWKEAFKDIRMQLGWLGFGMGLLFTYFFAETGDRFISANFLWSAEITLFILFVCCVLFLADQKLCQKNIFSRSLILSSGFLHVFFGIVYYFYIWFSISNNVLTV